MPGKTADELAIRELTARFNHLDSQKRNSELAATFVENGVLVARDERFEGRPAIETYFDTQQLGAPVNIGFGVTGRLGTTVHATTDNLITIEGDEATQLSFMMVFRQVPHEVVSGGLVIATERFEDRLVRTDDGWLFDQRIMTILQTNAAPDSSLQQVGVVESPH
ncbi:nuclear transport factor 2 family protein [Streptomyces sp. NPDC046909]|uniref:nuclear transport factor 2 family protein n=1 Tax=Streptomyces sp. NPDC046909 TaxID=3155617 RepID=UPI0033CB0842